MKKCEICKKEIKKKDNYVRLTDYLKGEFYKEMFYHTICFNNQIKRQNPEQLQTKKAIINMLAKANRMLNDVGYGEEVYQIK